MFEVVLTVDPEDRAYRMAASIISYRACLAMATVALMACAPVRAEQPEGPPQLGEPAVARAVLNGYRRYNSACNHCHGPDGVGSTFAPSLIEQPLPFARFHEIVQQGSASGTSVMRGFADDPNVAPHIRDIYLYLEARAAGRIGRGRPVLEP
jgi:mono/diheme cytochrome c family protein